MAIQPLLQDIVDFQYVTTGIVGDEERDCLIVVDKMSFQAARLMDPEIVVKHANLFPFFADKVDNISNPAAYNYFAIQLPNDTVKVVGYPWVNDDTFKTIAGRIRNYSISNFSEKMAGPIAKLFNDLGCTFTYNDVTK